MVGIECGIICFGLVEGGVGMSGYDYDMIVVGGGFLGVMVVIDLVCYGCYVLLFDWVGWIKLCGGVILLCFNCDFDIFDSLMVV